jgi:hypothetical protein
MTWKWDAVVIVVSGQTNVVVIVASGQTNVAVIVASGQTNVMSIDSARIIVSFLKIVKPRCHFL